MPDASVKPEGEATANAGFVHLRVRSAYSLSEGAIRIKDLVTLCAEQRMPAAAISDRNNLFGALEFSLAARAAGVQPIPAVLLGVRAEDKRGANSLAQAPPPDELLVLAKDEAGLANLLKLSSKAFLSVDGGSEPQVDYDDLEACSEGLICLTGGLNGPVGRLLAQGQEEEGEQVLTRLAAAFPGRLYVEIMRHGLADEDRIEPRLIDMAYRLDLPLVATNDCYFADRGMYEAHDALLCIAGGTYVGQSDRRRLTPEHCFKTAGEMRVLFADIPEAVDNTLVIARRCAAMVECVKPLLPTYTKLDGRTEEEALRELSVSGLRARLETQVYTPDMDEAAREEAAKPYLERLEYELGTIIQMGYVGYFLIVADFVQWAKEQKIPVGPGRGSGAGSVVAWSLTITGLDPLRFGLLFERFLNPERVSMPDFDIDFCQDRRDEVIRYVQQEYGDDRVAQIITFGKLQARAVLRDVGRVLEMPYGQVDRICKLVPNNPAKPVTLQQAIDGEPLLQEMKAEDPAVRKLIDTALPLEGLYRHASTHAAGVVIGDRPLTELAPLYRDPRSDMPVTQYNMKFVEQAGLVKFDFLGLKTLTVIARAKTLIDARPDRAEPLDIDALPLDDDKTFDMLCRADTVGVFQLESSGMRDVLKKLHPNRFEDIVALLALYRPGPMDNIPTYIKRRHGEETPVYPHEKLKPVLEETYGIPVYQEQVMGMAQVLAGYTLGGADLLRRAMGKKIQSEMDAQRSTFVQGALETSGVEAKQANEIFDMINAFAGYGFVKGHSAAYGLIAYQTAWLKANYPVEFLAASMTLDLHNTDKLGVFRSEIDRQGIALLPPDVNASEVEFSVERPAEHPDGQVRYALAALKNVGAGAMAAVVREREENGPYEDLFDFANRLDPRAVNKKALENLAKSGAFDRLNPNRKQVFDSVDTLAGHAAAAVAERESNQVSLFGEIDDAAPRPKLADTQDWPQQERLTAEFEAIGFYLSAHPLEAYEKTCRKLGVISYRDVASGRARGNRVKLAGIVGGRRLMTTSRGSKMAFVQMSDASGAYEITLFQEVLSASRDLLDAGEPLVVTLDVQSRGEDEEPRLTALALTSLEQEAANAADGMEITLASPDSVKNLSGILHKHGTRGRGLVKLHLPDRPEGDIELDLGETFTITADLRKAVKSIPGVIAVQDL
ncbi:MAG: DNA polymerase III subunit alpha [Alphaproteobacteria bacterium]|nr:DNA polymerase III subunit alpha [Alphaproteobacteria bacterium]